MQIYTEVLFCYFYRKDSNESDLILAARAIKYYPKIVLAFFKGRGISNIHEEDDENDGIE